MIVKVFDYDERIPADSKRWSVIERYSAFSLVSAKRNAVAGLKRQYLVEDVTRQYVIKGPSGIIATGCPGGGRRTKCHVGQKKEPPGDSFHHFLVQFIGPVKPAWLKALSRSGAKPVAPYSGFTFVVRTRVRNQHAIARRRFVHWIGRLPTNWRLAEGAGRLADGLALAGKTGARAAPNRRGHYTVRFFSKRQRLSAMVKLRALGFEILNPDDTRPTLVVKTRLSKKPEVATQLRKVATVHGVSMVTRRSANRISNNRARALIGAESAASGHIGFGLCGSGEIIAIADTGLDRGSIDDVHPDFKGRVVLLKSYPIDPSWDFSPAMMRRNDGGADRDDGHGTHVAGSAVGDGAASTDLPGGAPRIRGIAPEARLVFQAIEQSDVSSSGVRHFFLAGIPSNLGRLFADAQKSGAAIHSNSWGDAEMQGVYDAQCDDVDEFAWYNPDFCILFSAGNEGQYLKKKGVIAPGSVTPPGVAKNCITVGASESDRPEIATTYGDAFKRFRQGPFASRRITGSPDNVAAFSGRGPTKGGRIKPDVVAPGTSILSTRSRAILDTTKVYAPYPASELYMYMDGTSMATPLVAGAVALIREYLRTQRGMQRPSSALLKAAVICSASFMNGSPDRFDCNQGFGRVNIAAIVAPPAPLAVRFVEGPGLHTGGLDELRVTVRSAGSDLRVVLVYTDFPGPRLINNLNLIVRDPAGKFWLGNAGTGFPQFDCENNVELVHICAAPAGIYRVQVVASNVLRGPQRFALAIKGSISQPNAVNEA